MAKGKNIVDNVTDVPAEIVEAPKAAKNQAKFSDDVKAVVAKYPHVHTVHINEKGEWHFMPTPGFKAYTREEILNG